jgi:hypothetical protein
LILKYIFFAQLSYFKLKLAPNCILFFGKNGWIESQKTKVKVTGKIGGGFKFHKKKLF